MIVSVSLLILATVISFLSTKAIVDAGKTKVSHQRTFVALVVHFLIMSAALAPLAIVSVKLPWSFSELIKYALKNIIGVVLVKITYLLVYVYFGRRLYKEESLTKQLVIDNLKLLSACVLLFGFLFICL